MAAGLTIFSSSYLSKLGHSSAADRSLVRGLNGTPWSFKSRSWFIDRGDARQPSYCLVGVFLGTAIGVLPGLGPTATIADVVAT